MRDADDLPSIRNVLSGRLVGVCLLAAEQHPLTWYSQAYLKFVGIDFEITPSNNHASPTGALPFLLPAFPTEAAVTIPSHKLQQWAIEQVHCEEEQQLNLRFDVYASLLDHRIRNAWVCYSFISRVSGKSYYGPCKH